jgi:hypothetical protein
MQISDKSSSSSPKDTGLLRNSRSTPSNFLGSTLPRVSGELYEQHTDETPSPHPKLFRSETRPDMKEIYNTVYIDHTIEIISKLL